MSSKRLLLNGRIKPDRFHILDLSKFSEKEKALVKLIQKLMAQQIPLTAENILLNGDRELLITYITMSNEKRKLNEENIS